MIKKFNDRIEMINKKWELLIVCTVALVLVLGATVGMGTMTSGFHLVDDHEFLEWVYQMKFQNMNIFEMIKNKVLWDFSSRYEPLYYTTRMFTCYLFGTNLIAYSILKAFEIILDMVFLYYCGREMGANKVYSLLFSLVAMVGYQSAVWWKLGPQEAQSTLLFSAGLYCMLRWLKSNKKKWMLGSILLFAMMVNYKESFIILMPFLILYVFYYEMKASDHHDIWKGIWECIKKRWGYLITLSIIFLVPVLIIVIFVGTNNYGVVGLDANASLSEYIEGITKSFSGDLKWYKRFGILFCMILLTYWEELKKLWKEMILTMVFLLPQFIIFGRSGIGERYILPSAIGFAYFFVLVIPKWKPLSGKRRVVYVLGILLLLAAHGRVTLREADYFRYRGESITTMLESVREMAKEDTNVLACFRPNEEGNLTINYWMKLHDFDNVYYWTEEDGTIDQICELWNLYTYSEEQYVEQDLEKMDIVVMYNRTDRHWEYDMTMDLSGFQEVPCGTLTIYVREGSVDRVIEPQIEGLKIHF